MHCLYLLVNEITSANHMVTMKSRQSKRWHQNKKESDFKNSMIVGPRQAGLSISEMSDIQGFSCITISRVHARSCRVQLQHYYLELMSLESKNLD